MTQRTVTVLAVIILIMVVVMLRRSNEGFEVTQDWQSYCMQQATDDNNVMPDLIPFACKNQDAYLLSSGVWGGPLSQL